MREYLDRVAHNSDPEFAQIEAAKKSLAAQYKREAAAKIKEQQKIAALRAKAEEAARIANLSPAEKYEDRKRKAEENEKKKKDKADTKKKKVDDVAAKKAEDEQLLLSHGIALPAMVPAV